jgi:phage terminase small subunit
MQGVRKLNPRESAFVLEYCKDKNATQAAIRAGYSKRSANSKGPQLCAKVSIRQAIDEQLHAQETRTLITADRILTELYRIAICDVGQAFDSNGTLKKLDDIPEDVRRAISGIEVDELWAPKEDGRGKEQVGVTRKIKFWNKNESLIALAKHLKLLVERFDMTSGDAPIAFSLTMGRPKDSPENGD